MLMTPATRPPYTDDAARRRAAQHAVHTYAARRAATHATGSRAAQRALEHLRRANRWMAEAARSDRQGDPRRASLLRAMARGERADANVIASRLIGVYR
ncbi:MAG TPA: hypothetical protein VFP72_22110 [Kineosporiaceae bacterium]|nr:hypothetical protein [Kineosporiaceae bacterium]